MSKSQSTKKPQIARAYVADEASIELMAVSAGLPKKHVFCGDISAPSWKMRPGELLAVFDLRAFGRTRYEMVAGVRTVHDMGAFVYTLDGGLISGPGDGAEMLNRALGKVHGEDRKTPERAKAMAQARHAARKKERMSIRDAKRIWKNIRDYPAWELAIAAMPGWGKNTAYNELGKRGGAGRPRKR